MIEQIESAQGWVIHQYPIRDHLLLIYVLTERSYFKGFYRVSKNKIGQQKPLSFSPYWISWKKNKQAINIQSLEFIGAPYWLKDLKLIVALYLNELIFNFCKSEDLDLQPHFYALYEAILQDPSDCPLLLLRQFEWQLLADCGYAIDFSCTASHQKIESHQYYQFSPESGFFESMEGLVGADIHRMEQGLWDEPILNQLKGILRQTIDHVLEGKKLHSRELLREWMLQKSE